MGMMVPLARNSLCNHATPTERTKVTIFEGHCHQHCVYFYRKYSIELWSVASSRTIYMSYIQFTCTAQTEPEPLVFIVHAKNRKFLADFPHEIVSYKVEHQGREWNPHNYKNSEGSLHSISP